MCDLCFIDGCLFPFSSVPISSLSEEIKKLPTVNEVPFLDLYIQNEIQRWWQYLCSLLAWWHLMCFKLSVSFDLHASHFLEKEVRGQMAPPLLVHSSGADWGARSSRRLLNVICWIRLANNCGHDSSVNSGPVCQVTTAATLLKTAGIKNRFNL